MIELVHPDDVNLARAALETVVDKQVGDLITIRVRTGHGTWRYLELRGAVRDGGDRENCVGVFLRDAGSRSLPPVTVRHPGRAWHAEGRYGGLIGRPPGAPAPRRASNYFAREVLTSVVG